MGAPAFDGSVGDYYRHFLFFCPELYQICQTCSGILPPDFAILTAKERTVPSISTKQKQRGENP
jgi:hypothetical protein